MDEERVRLDDSPQLSVDEQRRVAQICDILNAVVKGRDGHVRSHGLDPEIALPGGLKWGDVGTWGGSFERLREKDMVSIALFRAMGNNFNDQPIVIYHDPSLAPRPDRFINRWRRLSHECGPHWTVRLPTCFGEVGWRIEGAPVNVQTAYYQESTALMYVMGVDGFLDRIASRGAPRVIEIGGGFGPMAWFLCRAYENVRWYACDLPESLIHQTVYMAVCRPDKHHAIYVGSMVLEGAFNPALMVRTVDEVESLQNCVVSIPNFLLDDFKGRLMVDLAVNIESLSEMSVPQVRHYGGIVGAMIGEHGILFEQNGDHRDKVGGNWCKEHLVHDFQYRLSGATMLNGPPRIIPHRGTPDLWCNTEIWRLIPSQDAARSAQVLSAFVDPPGEFDLNFNDPRVGEILHRWFSDRRMTHSRQG